MMKNRSFFIAIFCAFILQGCSTLGSSHPAKVKEFKDALSSSTTVSVNLERRLQNIFSKQNQDSNIGYLELGRYEQLIQHTQQSQQNYTKATDVVSAESMAPVIRATKVAKDTKSILLNDKERDYEIPDYQITFLYTYQALNYLKQDKLEDAAVSIRNLSDAQDVSRYQHELDIQMKQQNKGILSQIFNMDALNGYLATASKYTDIDKYAKGAKNAYSNPLAYYMEAIIYEAYDGNYNNAFVSITNAKDASANNKYIDQTYQLFNEARNGKKINANQGRLTVIYEQGFVPSVDRCELSMPMDVALFASLALNANVPAPKVSLPCYKFKNIRPKELEISVVKDREILSKDKMAIAVDTSAIAAKSLQEAYPAILTREVLRFSTKTIATIAAARVAQQAGGEKYGALAGLSVTLAGSAYQHLTTVADQRSWLLLPNNIQLYMNNFPAGEYQVKVGDVNQSVHIEGGKNTLLWVTVADKYKSIQYNNIL